MAQPPSQAVRYSQGTKDIGAARSFPWEHPVPQTPFWDELPYPLARSFLTLFDKPDTPNPTNPPPTFDDPASSALTKPEKLNLLLVLLKERLVSKEAEVAAEQKTFYEVDYSAWDATHRSIAAIQHEQHDLDAAEETLRMLIARRQGDPANLMHQHVLAGVLLDKGQYAEAERLEVPVRDWLDGRLGRESPQALGARRMIARAVWMQAGRREEGEGLMREVEGIIAGIAEGSQWGVYVEGERELTRELWGRLKGKGS